MQGQQNLAAVAELDELEYQQPYPYNRGVDLVEQQAQASALYDGQYPWAPAPAEDREWMMRTAPDTDFLQQGQARPAMGKLKSLGIARQVRVVFLSVSCMYVLYTVSFMHDFDFSSLTAGKQFRSDPTGSTFNVPCL